MHKPMDENKEILDRGEDLLTSIKETLLDKAIANTQRILILVTLYLAKKLTLTELSRITGIEKGKLVYHIRVLEEKGYVVNKKHITVMGPRTFIEITARGEGKVREIIDKLTKLVSRRP